MIRRSAILSVLASGLLGGLVSAQGFTLPDAQRIELDNGAVFLLSEKRDVPLIGVEAIIRGGAVADPADKSGLSSLVAGLLEKGAGDRNAAEFAEAVAAVGGTLSARAALESISISGEFLARDADLMLGMLTDMLRRPALDAAEMTRLRDRQIDLIRAAKDSDPRALSPIYGRAFLFGEHPYGSPVDGNEESLARITASDVRQYYRDNIGADRLVIAIVGDYDAAAMAAKLGAVFGDWQPAAAPLPEVAPPAPQVGRRVLLVDKPDSTLTYFWIGNVGVAMDFSQRAELNIANTLFGGRYTSLLMSELRTKAGLTYGASSSLRRYSQPGSVAIVSFAGTDKSIAAVDLALELLDRMLNSGFDEQLIQSAKNYILGLFALDFETAAQLAAKFAALEANGLGAGYVNDYGPAIVAAESETLQAVIRAVYPSPDNLVFMFLGDAETIRDAVAKYGPVTEVSITETRFRPQ